MGAVEPTKGVLHYVKGMARACTLLTLLDLIYDNRSAAHFAPLLASATVVSARVDVHADVVSVAIANATISARGSIKLAHGVITGAGKLDKLADQAVVPDTVITMHNAQASQATAVRGARKTAFVAPGMPIGVEDFSGIGWVGGPVSSLLGGAMLGQHTHHAKVLQSVPRRLQSVAGHIACYPKVVHAVCSIY